MKHHVPPRRHSRRAALQALYAADLSEKARSVEPLEVADVFERITAHFDVHEGARAFADQLVRGVEAHRSELDARIAAHARNWRVDRMAAVDRNVLRIATFELAHTDTPDRVVIDEAIELARDFGSDRSPAFVNGVLDAIARDLRDERGPATASQVDA
ncbi:MAG: transcription antitermination factor NusB [Myxococcota bacterium]